MTYCGVYRISYHTTTPSPGFAVVSLLPETKGEALPDKL
jgi:hypothetical protein